MSFPIATVLAAAQRSQAAYVIDQGASKDTFTALGYLWHGLYQTADHQAVVSSDADGRCYLSIAGTRFSDGKLGDVLDDLNVSWVNVGQGAEVLKGAYDGCRELYGWARGLMGPSTDWHIEGHSLGGWRARYAPLFLDLDDIAQLITFESPRSANAVYYERFKALFANGTLSVVNGRDIFVDWPWLSTEARHPPQDWWHLLDDGTVSIEDPSTWPGGISKADHDIELVVERLTGLAAGADVSKTPS